MRGAQELADPGEAMGRTPSCVCVRVCVCVCVCVAHRDGQDFGNQGSSAAEQSLLHWPVGQVVIKADFKVTVPVLVTGRGLSLSSYHNLSSEVLDLEHWSNTSSDYCSPLPLRPSPCPHVPS